VERKFRREERTISENMERKEREEKRERENKRIRQKERKDKSIR